MLIGLDGIPLSEPRTGVGHYTFELARALAAIAPTDEFELAYPSTYSSFPLSDDDEADERSTRPRNLTIRSVPVGIFGRHWWSTGLPAYVRKRGFHVFHGTNFDVPLWNRCPSVLTIHDLSTLLHANTHKARAVRRARRRLPLMSRAATMIITPTESVRREVCSRLGVSTDKVVAVPEAARRVFRPIVPQETIEIRRRLGLETEAPFLLAVGTIEPRKNLSTLVRAFERVLQEFSQNAPLDPGFRELRLVVTGSKGWMSNEFFEDVSSSVARDQIHFTGYVSDIALRALYSSCAAFVYPSLYEGFGLPPIEAMACGAPVIASRVAAHSEVLGEDAARLFNPTDIDSLAKSIIEVIGNQETSRRLAAAGKQHVARYTWERTAQLTRQVYDDAIRRRRA